MTPRHRTSRSPAAFARRVSVCAAPVALLALSACGGSTRTQATAPPQATATAPPTTSTKTVTVTTPTSAAPATQPAAAPVCLTAHLTLKLASGGGAAGTAYYTYELTNVGSGTCSMIGYAGFAVLDARGRIVQHAATRGADQPEPVRLVTLEPGQGAEFLVNSTDVIPSPGCPHEYTGTTLQVYPPNQRAALLEPYHGTFCNLKVGPVEPAR